jgi:hypothetical protein
LSVKIRDQVEGSIPLEPDDREVATIKGEHGPDAVTLGEVDERGVGELQANVLITAHDGGDGGKVFRLEWSQGEKAVLKAPG